MNRTYLSLLLMSLLFLASCVSKKKFTAVQAELTSCNEQLGKCGESLNDYMNRLETAEAERLSLRSDLNNRQDQLTDLRSQLEDCKTQRDKQLTQVGDLTVMSKGAQDNMKATLEQLRQKDQYIHLLQAAKSKADSLNLALAVNLKSQLKTGID